MHTPVILLTKARWRHEAIGRVYDFMEDYENKLFDWYTIGGRWHNSLAPKLKEWQEIIQKHVIIPNGENNKKYQESKIFESKLQQIWRDIDMKGKNPHFIHFNLPSDGDYYDVMPLKDCLEQVSSWIISKSDLEDDYKKKLAIWKDDAEMLKVINRKHKKKLNGEFTDDRNIYNIDLLESEVIPENYVDYFAVLVDMHK